MAEHEHLTVPELAKGERTTESTVYGWIHKGTAPRSMRIGRRRLFRLADVVAWEESQASDQVPAA